MYRIESSYLSPLKLVVIKYVGQMFQFLKQDRNWPIIFYSLIQIAFNLKL